MKKILLIILVLMMVPIAFGMEKGIVGEPITLTSNHVLAQSGYYNNVTAYISIVYPNGTQAVLSQPTVNSTVQNGVFLYNYTPTVTGIYFTTTNFYNSSDFIGVGSDTFLIEEDVEMNVSIIIGLIAIIIYFIYLGKDLMSKPQAVDENKHIQKWINTQTIGLFTYMLASWLVLILFFVLKQISATSSMANFFDGLFVVFLWIIPMLNIGYWMFFAIFKIVNAFNMNQRHRR